jgi:hypothetical protein
MSVPNSPEKEPDIAYRCGAFGIAAGVVGMPALGLTWVFLTEPWTLADGGALVAFFWFVLLGALFGGVTGRALGLAATGRRGRAAFFALTAATCMLGIPALLGALSAYPPAWGEAVRAVLRAWFSPWWGFTGVWGLYLLSCGLRWGFDLGEGGSGEG